MFNCIICHKSASKLARGYADFPRVGSDSRPLPPGGRIGQCLQCGTVQKPVDEGFRAECQAIYDGYVMYAQSEKGSEPTVFDGVPCGRSLRMMEAVTRAIGLPNAGSLLDVGCGNGNMLRAFASLRPDWDMKGLELDDRHRDAVEGVCGPGSLCTGELSGVNGSFDVITAMHVMEHLLDPTTFLNQVKERLTAEGVLVIQLPLWRKNPFDLVVADHVVHYDREALLHVLAQAGFESIFVSEEAVPRELTVVARPGTAESGTISPQGGLGKALRWLQQVRGEATGAMEKVGKARFGIVGTGNAAMWLTEALGGVGFYVDDDPSRQGVNSMTGCPVYAPEQVPEGATVVICLPPDLSVQVYERVRTLPANWLVTPRLEN